MPPDFPFAEFFNPVVGVEDEPQKILDEDHPDVKAKQQELQLPCPGYKEKRQVDNADHEDAHEDMIAGNRAVAGKLCHPAFFNAPAGQVGRPALFPLYLDFPEGEDKGHKKHED